MPKFNLRHPEDQKGEYQCWCALTSLLQSVTRVNGRDLSWNLLACVSWLCWALLGLVQSSKVSDGPFLSQETGFWFVLHHVPTGPSAGMYSPGYSEHMPMGKFSNNRAHSNYRVSLHATGTLPSEQTASLCSFPASLPLKYCSRSICWSLSSYTPQLPMLALPEQLLEG